MLSKTIRILYISVIQLVSTIQLRVDKIKRGLNNCLRMDMWVGEIRTL